MKISRIEAIDEAALLDTLRRTRLKGYDRFPVYETAEIALLEGVDTDRLSPPQNYVLLPSVTDIQTLRQSLLAFGHDIFRLRGGLRLWPAAGADDPQAEQGLDPIPVLPPIVEESAEADGTVWLINDGMHRVYAARKAGEPINIVLVRGVPKDYPYYAYPLEGGWAQVKELPALDGEFQKKVYRQPDNYKSLFRDFNELFPGVQKQRRRTNPADMKP